MLCWDQELWTGGAIGCKIDMSVYICIYIYDIYIYIHDVIDTYHIHTIQYIYY